MWLKTVFGLIAGLALAVSAILNLHFLLPAAVDTRLFTGLIMSFVIWGCVMTYVYRADTVWRPAGRVGILLAASAALNAALMM